MARENLISTAFGNSIFFYCESFYKNKFLPVAILAIACCIFLAAMTFIILPKKYLIDYAVDGIIEIIFLAFSMIIIFKIQKFANDF